MLSVLRSVHRHSYRSILALASGVALVSLQAFPVAAQVTDWAQVQRDAQKEGKVVVYSSATNDSTRQLGRLFEETYGIPVEVLQIRGAEMRERLRTEAAAGRHISDVIDSNSAIRAMLANKDAAQLEIFARHPELPNAKLLRPEWKDDGIFVPLHVGMISILANSELVPEGSEPKNWKDLLDPKWKGKMIADDPRAAGAGNGLFSVLRDRFGPDYLKALAAQDLVMSRQQNIASRQVAQKEYSLYLGFPFRGLSQMRGLPVRGLIPSEGTSVTSGIVAQIAKAPHPNAALLFLNFVLSDKAQDILADSGVLSVTGRPARSLDSDIKQFASAKVLGEANPLTADEAFEAFAEIFGK